MPIVYLTPQDIAAEQAAEVLAFLNSVQTAEEIAERIEIANELDVGVRVGQRILDYRSQLPQGFTTLEQLMDVNQVGPERFTEIVAVILGLDLNISVDQLQIGSLSTLVQQEVARQLQSQRSANNTNTSRNTTEPYHITILPPAQPFWVGQEMTLSIKVLDSRSGKPVANLPVTFESHDMWLSTSFGYESRQGQVINSRTATDGSLRLRLRNIFDEALSVDQFTALQEALRILNLDAAAPRDMLEQFQNLITQYEDVRNKQLRTAMDIIYRSTGRLLTQALNPADYLYQWQYQSTLLRVYINGDATSAAPFSETATNNVSALASASVMDATVSQVGIHQVKWRQWLRPWYQIYLDYLAGGDLQQQFLDAKNNRSSDAQVTASILGNAYRFVAGRNGLIGEALSKKVIDKEIQRFLATEITEFSPEIKSSLFPSLLLAGNSLSSGDTGTLALVNQTKADLETSINARITDTGINNDEILNSLSTLNSRVDSLDNNISLTQDSIAGINNSLVQINGNITRIDNSLLEVTNDFGQLQLDFNTVDSRIDTLSNNVNQQGNRFNEINTQLGSLNNRISGLDTQITGMDTQITGLNNQVTTLNRDVVLRTDITRDPQGRLVDIPTTPPIRR